MQRKSVIVQLFSLSPLIVFHLSFGAKKYIKIPTKFFQNCGSDFYAYFLMGTMAHFFEVTALPRLKQ
jgi:hypothetical protein